MSSQPLDHPARLSIARLSVITWPREKYLKHLVHILKIESGAKNDIELLILLSLPLESWVYKCTLSFSGHAMNVGLRHPANQASTLLPKLYPQTSKHFKTLMDAFCF